MGTNFFTSDGTHIGKRSAAGRYCWDCGVTLCAGGNNLIHSGRGEWHETCPHCGGKPATERLECSTGGRELGFNTSKPAKKIGVASCCSFTWAIHPIYLPRRGIIKDEYDRKYTIKQFMAVMHECPVQFYDSIGQLFS